jgi:glycosyltransferase involved in cell wall biosynthesis
MRPNLLMLSGDNALAQGKRGAFANTLSVFSQHWGRVDVLCPQVAQPATLQPFDNVWLHPAPVGKAGYVRWLYQYGQALHRQHAYQILVSHDYGLFLNGWGGRLLSRSLQLPQISEIHHVEGYPRAANLRERLQAWLTWGYVRAQTARVAAFRVPNRTELPPLLQRWGVPAAKILLLYSLYLDLETFCPQPASVRTYHALWVGRLVANKAPALFLQALAKVCQTLPDLQAVLLGSGPLAAQLRASAQQLGLTRHLTWLDWLPDTAALATLYRQANALVCTSYSEGGPRVVAEALACGTPVITSAVGLSGELITPGQNGFICDWQPDDFAARICQVAEPAAQAQLAAYAPQAVQGFAKQDVLARYAAGLQTFARP